MNDKIIHNIAGKMNEKSTEDLLAIWNTNNSTEWSEEAFTAVAMVLKERNVPFSDHRQLDSKEPEASHGQGPSENMKQLKNCGLGLAGIILCVGIDVLAWKYLSGGQGIMRNVLRNTILAASIPVIFYSISLYFKGKSEG